MSSVRTYQSRHWGKSNRKTYRVILGEGVPCPRCGRSTQIREHAAITERRPSQAYYFRRWFYCRSFTAGRD